MTRLSIIALSIAMLAGAASAEPLDLNNAQMDRLTAGSLGLNVLTLAATHLPGSVSLPAPQSAPLTVPHAADVAISIDATVPPAATIITHPGH